jgi:hypothetical protein
MIICVTIPSSSHYHPIIILIIIPLLSRYHRITSPNIIRPYFYPIIITTIIPIIPTRIIFIIFPVIIPMIISLSSLLIHINGNFPHENPILSVRFPDRGAAPPARREERCGHGTCAHGIWSMRQADLEGGSMDDVQVYNQVL